jgi:hypothetical protein
MTFGKILNSIKNHMSNHKVPYTKQINDESSDDYTLDIHTNNGYVFRDEVVRGIGIKESFHALKFSSVAKLDPSGECMDGSDDGYGTVS